MTEKATLINMVLRTAKENPNRVAVYYKDQKITYHELSELIKVFKNYFEGIAKPGPVAIHLSRTPKLIAALMGCWAAERPFVTLDPSHPFERKEKILFDCDPSMVISDDSIEKVIEYRSKSNKEYQFETSISYLLYTSGSTGEPKGIAIRDKSVKSLIDWAHNQYFQDELKCVLASTTVTFDLAIFEIFVPLTCGQSIFLAESILELIEDPERFLHVTLVNTVPSAMREIVRRNAIPKKTQVINLAGEALEWSLVDRIYSFPGINKVYNLYGPSEDTTYSTFFLCDPDRRSRKSGEKAVSIGKPISGTKALVLDDNLTPVSDGSIGEICLLGEGLALGYHSNLKLTRDKFLHTESGRLYRTGDLGFVDKNGDLHYKGRIDHQVKIRGYRIELEEIESQLLDCDEVFQAITAVIEENFSPKIAASIQVSSNTKQQDDVLENIKLHLRKHLPEYMIPQKWLMTCNPLPRTTSGKLSRQALIHQIGCQLKAFKSAGDFESLIHDLLHSDVDLEKSFLDHGGDSLSALRLVAECQQKWGCFLPLKTVLDHAIPLDALKVMVSKGSPRSNTIQRVSQDAVSDSEYRMWKVMVNHSTPQAYNVSVELKIRGKFDYNRFLKTCTGVTVDSFQYNYKFIDGQLKKQRTTAPFKIIQTGKDSIVKLREDIFHRPFDLEKDFLARIACTKMNDHYLFMFCAPHVVIDGLGLDAFFQKISKRYEGELEYYAAISKKDNAKKRVTLPFWKEQFKDYVQSVSWPSSQLKNPGHQVTTRSIPKEDIVPLKNFASKIGVTFPVLLLSVLKIALYRMNLGEDLVIACPVANRAVKENQDAITNLTNTLPIRTKINSSDKVIDFVLQVYQNVLSILEYQEVSIDLIFQELIKEQGLSESIFDILFSYMDFGLHSLAIDNCHVERSFPIPRASKSPFVFSVIPENSGAVELRLEYTLDRITPSFSHSLISVFQKVLSEIEENSQLTIENIPIIPSKQVSTLQNMIQPSMNTKSNIDLVSWIQGVAEQFKEKIAIDDHSNTLTYRQLWASASCVAAGLHRRGVISGSSVGIVMHHSPELIVSIVGVLISGCHYVPMDPKNPISRNQYIIENSKIGHVIIESSMQDMVFYGCEYMYYQDIQSHQSDDVPFSCGHSSPSDLAYIIYTSGTTGNPKGVAITHENITTLFKSCQKWARFSSSDIWTLFHSYAFDFSVWEIFGALLYGGKLVILSNQERYDPIKLIKQLEFHQVTILNQTPTAFRNLLSSKFIMKAFPRMIIFGGEALYSDVLEKWWQLYGTGKTQLINMYGITETTIHVTHQELKSKMDGSVIGKPLEHMGIVIVNKNGKLCPVGVPGEMWVCGHGLCKGYIHHQELNDKKFIEESLLGLPLQCYYKSGDLAVLREDSTLEYLGRIDDQIKISGYRLESTEIIGALKKIDGINDAYVCKSVRKDGYHLLIAYYTANRKINSNLINDELKLILPHYAIPSCYMHLDCFPMTINGKIDKTKLSVPKIEEKAFAKTPYEVIKSAWRDALKIAEVEDNRPFFELGGSSIKAAMLIDSINNQIGSSQKALSIVDVFRYPTILQQVDILNSRLSIKESS